MRVYGGAQQFSATGGGYPNFAIGKGENALFSLTTVGGNFFAPVLFGPAVFQS